MTALERVVKASQAGCSPVIGLRPTPIGKEVVRRCLCGECPWLRLYLERLGKRYEEATS